MIWKLKQFGVDDSLKYHLFSASERPEGGGGGGGGRLLIKSSSSHPSFFSSSSKFLKFSFIAHAHKQVLYKPCRKRFKVIWKKPLL